MPGPVELDDKPAENPKGGYTGPRPEDIRKILEVMPGPGDILDLRVLVQNRSEQAVYVDGRDIVAVISVLNLTAFYEGTSSNPEYEKNVVAQDINGRVSPVIFIDVIAHIDAVLNRLDNARATAKLPTSTANASAPRSVTVQRT